LHVILDKPNLILLDILDTWSNCWSSIFIKLCIWSSILLVYLSSHNYLLKRNPGPQSLSWKYNPKSLNGLKCNYVFGKRIKSSFYKCNYFLFPVFMGYTYFQEYGIPNVSKLPTPHIQGCKFLWELGLGCFFERLIPDRRLRLLLRSTANIQIFTMVRVRDRCIYCC